MGVVASGRVIALVGEAPKRFGVSEWENVEKAQCKLFDSRRPDGFGNACAATIRMRGQRQSG